MGSNKRIVTSATGFPVNNHTWRFIQQAWREPLEAIAQNAGDKTIVAGLMPTLFNLNGTVAAYGNGYVSYNGEILPFVGGAPGITVTLVEETVNGNYDADIDNDGQQDNLPQYITRYLKFGNDGIATFPFSQLYRNKTIKELSQFSLPSNLVQDPAYVHTDNNLTTAMINAWNALISNVRADWNVSNPQSQAFILNKPTNLVRALYRGNVVMGDVGINNSSFNCTFPNVGTSSYMVLGGLEVNGAGGDVNVTWAVSTKTATYFTVHFSEAYQVPQNLRFRFLLTEMYNQ
jgi:hypothetical protein